MPSVAKRRLSPIGAGASRYVNPRHSGVSSFAQKREQTYVDVTPVGSYIITDTGDPVLADDFVSYIGVQE